MKNSRKYLLCVSCLLLGGQTAARLGSNNKSDNGGSSSSYVSSSLERKLEESEHVHVFIGYKSSGGGSMMSIQQFDNVDAPDLSSILSHPVHTGKALNRVNAVKAYISRSELEALRNNPDIEYVEEDAPVYAFSGTGGAGLAETTFSTTVMASTGDEYPYGILMSQADTPIAPWPSRAFTTASTSGACSDPDTFKVAIIDSGLQGRCK